MADTVQWCSACRQCNMIHCADVWYGCDGMLELPKADPDVAEAIRLMGTGRSDEAGVLMNKVHARVTAERHKEKT